MLTFTALASSVSALIKFTLKKTVGLNSTMIKMERVSALNSALIYIYLLFPLHTYTLYFVPRDHDLGRI